MEAKTPYPKCPRLGATRFESGSVASARGAQRTSCPVRSKPCMSSPMPPSARSTKSPSPEAASPHRFGLPSRSVLGRRKDRPSTTSVSWRRERPGSNCEPGCVRRCRDAKRDKPPCSARNRCRLCSSNENRHRHRAASEALCQPACDLRTESLAVDSCRRTCDRSCRRRASPDRRPVDPARAVARW